VLARFSLVGGNIRYILAEFKTVNSIKEEIGAAVKRLPKNSFKNPDDVDIFGEVPSLCFSIVPLDPKGALSNPSPLKPNHLLLGLPFSRMVVQIRSDFVNTLIMEL
jgi:hypothetical protein